MNEVITSLLNRRCVRKYKSQQITDEQLSTILEVGKYAPSAMAKQCAVMVAVQDKETLSILEKLNARVIGNDAATPFYGAPTVVVVLADLDAGPAPYQDGVLAMGNLMNAAHAIGVDSCWVDRAQQTFETEEGKALLKKWGLNGRYQGIGNCLLGYRDCDYPEPAPRREGTVVIVK